MKAPNLLFLNESQNISGNDLNNNFENQEQNLIFKDKTDILFPLNNKDLLFPKNSNENICLNEFIKIMDDSKSDTTKPDIIEDESTESLYFIKNSKVQKNEFQSTLNTSKNISFTTEAIFSKNINFKTVLHHKRGRKSTGKEKRKKILKRYHGSGDFDNVQRKIQVNFITFLINLANDAIKTVLGKKTKYFFKDVKYGLKKIVNHKYVENLKKCKYSDIIQMKISLKNKKLGENLNRDTFLEICKISPELQKFFDQNYLYIFQKYYYGMNNNENIIDFDGLKVELSPLTKGFLNLLKKNEGRKEKFNSVVNDVYFSGLNYANKSQITKPIPFFVTNLNLKE